ncbi:MAG: hypothetical protein QM756_05230 [Polyangiaceae bacterium]
MVFGAAGGTSITPQSCEDGATQVWDGFTEDFYFKPLKQWRLTITQGGSGAVCGDATYVASGEAALPPATDPDASYPPGLSTANSIPYGQVPWPGTTYSVVEGAARDSTVHLRLAGTQLWSDWCKLQWSYQAGAGYSCLPPNGGKISSGDTCTYVEPLTLKEKTVSSMKCLACDTICQCYASGGCTARDAASIVFDLQLVDGSGGKAMRGTVDAPDGKFTIALNLVAGSPISGIAKLKRNTASLVVFTSLACGGHTLDVGSHGDGGAGSSALGGSANFGGYTANGGSALLGGSAAFSGSTSVIGFGGAPGAGGALAYGGDALGAGGALSRNGWSVDWRRHQHRAADVQRRHDRSLGGVHRRLLFQAIAEVALAADAIRRWSRVRQRYLRGFRRACASACNGSGR